MNIEEFRDILFEKRSLAFVALTKKNGKPHVTPVWFDIDIEGDLLYMKINIATGRVKSANIEKKTLLAVAVVDPDNPYRYLGFEGIVEEVNSDPKVANSHKDELARKYLGVSKFPYYKESEDRIFVKIKLYNQYAAKKQMGKN